MKAVSFFAKPLPVLVVTSALMVAAGAFALLDLDGLVLAALVGAAVLPLIPLLREMFEKLRRGQTGVDVVALLAVAGALALGEYLTAAVIGVMLATGHFLEDYAAGRAERELTSLLARAPRVAHRVKGDRVETVPIGEVRAGDRLLIKAGEVVPVDGVVLSPSALIDQSALTGEPLPVDKETGDLVASGTLNAADAFHLHATDDAEHSTFAGIVRLVETARESKAPSTRLADRWAGWFVPLALGVAGLAWLVSGDPVRGLAVLVVATPCPLILAVPIAVVSGISRAANQGIVFRGGGALETLAQVRHLVIDKTGTVTVGRPSLRSIRLFSSDFDEDRVLALSASVDQVSTHVLARAIVDAAHERGVRLEVPDDATEEAGAGVSARIDGHAVSVGKLGWLLESASLPPEGEDFNRRMSRVAPTAVFVAIDGTVQAAMVFDDAIRPDAAATIRALRRTGVRRVVMATGDHPVVAQSVGMAVGVDEVIAEATPTDKVKILSELQRDGVTAMVGDGINDAPALAAADVGVAMGARGATASSEAADVVLVVDELQRLADGIGIARRSRRIAVQSAAVGMGLSLGAMGFAAFGLLAPIVGALIQEGIDIIAITNSLRALGGGPKRVKGQKLPADMSARLAAEHREIRPRLESIRDTADQMDLLEPGEALEALRAIERFLVDEVLPHEAADEHEIYPYLAELLPGDDPMSMMSREHREIFHLIEVFGHQISDLPEEGPDPADIRDLRRTMYGLHAILRLHFDQEEDLYLALKE